MDIAYSIGGIPIRLTEERWGHIIANRPYMASYYDQVLAAIADPTWVLRGYAGALVAVLALGRPWYLHVVYREVAIDDGFVITAFFTHKLNRSAIVWPKKS